MIDSTALLLAEIFVDEAQPHARVEAKTLGHIVLTPTCLAGLKAAVDFAKAWQSASKVGNPETPPHKGDGDND